MEFYDRKRNILNKKKLMFLFVFYRKYIAKVNKK